LKSGVAEENDNINNNDDDNEDGDEIIGDDRNTIGTPSQDAPSKKSYAKKAKEGGQTVPTFEELDR
jgi:hypothetical protein